MKNKDPIGKEDRVTHYDELINSMPHKDKILLAQKRIQEFIFEIIKYNTENPKQQHKEITVSFSGGKDSTVLLDLVLKVHHELKCEIYIQPCYAAEITFPTTYKFIKEIIENYQKTYPFLKDPLIMNSKLPWLEILQTKGYPIFSKQVSVLINRTINAKTKNSLCKWFFGIDEKNTNTTKYKLAYRRLFLLDQKMLNKWPTSISPDAKAYFKYYTEPYFFSEKCCDFVKGTLKHDKRPAFVGTMAVESNMRKKSWIDKGCNIFNSSRLTSRPLSVWKTSDVWKYIKDNNLMVNPAYGYNHQLSLDEQKLQFNRLGCSSCPFGSHIEQRLISYAEKKKISNINLQNRFEILKDKYPSIYHSQIIMTGMYKVIIDMGILVRNDKFYTELFELRQKQIAKWYAHANVRNNILCLLSQIENFKDYKQKGSSFAWNYTIDEINQSMNFFGFDKTTKSEFDLIRKQTASTYKIPKHKQNFKKII